MYTKLPDELGKIQERTAEITAELRVLKRKQHLTDFDLKRIAELRSEVTSLCPPERFAWVDGRPVIDVLNELVALYSGMNERLPNSD